jgi:hypothetical protein
MLSRVTSRDGGADTAGASDALAFRNVSESLDGDILFDWEPLVVGTGSDLSLDSAQR